MCRYRYYYFGSCRHQQTVLFDFCEEAQYIQNEPESLSIASGTINQGKKHVEVDSEQAQSPCGGTDGRHVGSGDSQQEGEGASVAESTNLDSHRSITSTQSQHSTNSSFDRGSASIIAEPGVDWSSLPVDHTSHPSPSATSSHDMAGSLFGGALSRWISPGASGVVSNTEVHSHNQSSASGSLQSRRHPPGIRERTDESCDLTPTSEILQHLAESGRLANPQHTGMDGDRLSSFESIDTDRGRHDPVQAKQEEYENMLADIDQLKEVITKFREEADRDRKTPKIEQELANDRFLATRSLRGRPGCGNGRHETAASRLQKQHEAESREHNIASEPHEGVQQPLSPLDFPALDIHKQSSHNLSQADSQPRKLSYADAITSGMLDANNHAFSVALAQRDDSKALESSSDEPLSASTGLSRTKTLSTAATQHSLSGREEEDCSIIVSPRSIDTVSSTNDPVVVLNSQLSAQNGKPIKGTPHFAQPTQSYSRRTGESIRSPISPVSPNSAPGSPTKSSRAKEPFLATEKRATQRQQKRKSLPGDWMGAEAQQPHVKDHHAPSKMEKPPLLTPKQVAAPEVQASPPSPDGWQKVARRNVKEQVNSKRKLSNQSQPKSPMRSNASAKPVSNIAKSRIPVTTQAVKTKRGSLPTAPAQVRHEGGDANGTAPTLQRSNTTSSDASSVLFILERESPTQHFAESQPSSIDRTQHIVVAGAPHEDATSTSAIPPSDVSIGEPAQMGRSARLQLPAHADQQAQPAPSQTIVQSSKEASISSWFPKVSNTTVKRRDSHGHLLTPIMRSLDAKGLLNRTTANNAVLESYLKSVSAKAFSDSLKEARDRQPNPPSRTPGRRPHASEKSESSVQSVKGGPPHLRNQRTAECVNGPKVLASKESPSVVGLTQTALNVPGAPRVGIPSDSNAGKNLRVSSLRATAEEFKPTEATSAQINSIPFEDVARYWPGREWDALSNAQKKQIYDLRDSFTQDRPVTAAAILPPPAFNLQQSRRIMPTRLVHPNLPSGYRRTVSPDDSTVGWVRRDVHGKETPITFGRAPPPVMSPAYNPSTSTVSSPDSASPWATPMAPTDRPAMPLTPGWKQATSAWHIRSKRSPVRYGWTGGDGKEIKFLGYGPYAERDPNSVVDFDFQGRTSSCHAFVPNGFCEDKENSPAPVKVAPKSQRQWAEMLWYKRVPCGNVEITEAVEHCTPFGSQLAGYCYDCMAN